MSSPSSFDALRKAFEGLQLTGWISMPVQYDAPWALPIPLTHANFYGLLDGDCQLDVGEMRGLTVHSGDLVIVKEGTGGRLFDHNENFNGRDAGRGPNRRFRPISARVRPAKLICGGFTPREGSITALLATVPSAVQINGSGGKFAPSIDDLLRLMLAESAREHPETSVVLDRLLSILLIKAIRQAWISSSAGPETVLETCSDAEVGAILNRIHQRPDYPWTVAGLAAEVQLSRSTFAARFLIAVGKSPLRYLRDVRMRTASRLLEDRQCPLKEIAAKTGYKTSSALSNAFKRWSGSSPEEYRRLNRPSEALRPGGDAT